MISYTSLRIFINAAFDVIAILFLIFVFISCVFRKTKNQTNLELGSFLFILIILLACNLATWVIGGIYISSSNAYGLYKHLIILTVLDFFLYNLASIMLLNYILSLTNCINTKRKKNIFIHILILYAFIMTGIFVASINKGWFYTFSKAGYVQYTILYYVIFSLLYPAIILSYVFIFKNLKILKKKAIPLLSYLISPLILSFIDELYGLSLNYVCLAFVALSIYIGVDIEQERELLAKEAEIARQETENKEIKMRLMVSQIQPHFLYNTLGTIYQLCASDANLARQAIKDFTKYLQINMGSLEKSNLVSFENELEHTKNYLSIELLRFSDALKIEYDIECTDFKIPAISLQPLVQYAVKHGIRSRAEGGTVTISTKRKDGKIYITVHDDGMGFNSAEYPDDKWTQISINNIHKRLEYMCKGSLEIQSETGIGTTSTITLEDSKNELAFD